MFYYALVPCGEGLKSAGGTVADPPAIAFAFGSTSAPEHTFTLATDDYSLAPSPCPSGENTCLNATPSFVPRVTFASMYRALALALA